MRFEELYLQYKYISAILKVNAEMMKIRLNIRAKKYQHPYPRVLISG